MISVQKPYGRRAKLVSPSTPNLISYDSQFASSFQPLSPATSSSLNIATQRLSLLGNCKKADTGKLRISSPVAGTMKYFRSGFSNLQSPSSPDLCTDYAHVGKENAPNYSGNSCQSCLVHSDPTAFISIKQADHRPRGFMNRLKYFLDLRRQDRLGTLHKNSTCICCHNCFAGDMTTTTFPKSAYDFSDLDFGSLPLRSGPVPLLPPVDSEGSCSTTEGTADDTKSSSSIHGMIFRNCSWPQSGFRFDAHTGELFIDGEAAAIQFHKTVTCSTFPIRKIKTLFIVLDANNWSLKLDDSLALGLSCFGKSGVHQLKCLRIYVKGNTLFTKRLYFINNGTMEYAKSKAQYNISTKYQAWVKLYDGIATRQEMKDTPPTCNQTNHRFLNGLRNCGRIRHVYIAGAMEMELKRDIIAMCAAQPLKNPDLDPHFKPTFLDSRSIIRRRKPQALVLPQLSPSLQTENQVEACQATKVNHTEHVLSTEDQFDANVNYRQTPFRLTMSGLPKQGKALLKSKELNQWANVVIDVADEALIRPEHFEDIVRINVGSTPEEESSNFRYDINGHRVQNMHRLFGQGECHLGWKIFRIGGKWQVAREDELDDIAEYAEVVSPAPIREQ